MELSKRIRNVVGDGPDGWNLLYRAWEKQARGEPVTMLTIGDHDIKTDPAILNAMKASMDRGNLGYAALTGAPALRAAVAARVVAAGGAPAGAENVIILPGGQAALFASVMAVLDPGDEMIVLDPFYATYMQTVRAAGGVPVVVSTRSEDGFQPDPAAIEAALTPRTRAILLNSPNNPTGAMHRPERLEAVAELARARDLWIVSDEVYYTQPWAGPHGSVRDLPRMAEQVIVVNSLSKSHAMTGCRLGWVVAPVNAAQRIGELSISTNYGVPGFIQDAAVFALTDPAGAAAEAEITARYRRRRDIALHALGNGPGFRVVAPEGGMYVMLDVRETGLSGEDFALRLLDETGIAVMPGESFGDATSGHIRIALTVSDAEIDSALRRVAEFAGNLAVHV